MKQLSIVCICIMLILTLSQCNKHDRGNIDEPKKSAPVLFTVSADSTVVNPYGYTPLSALVSFTSPLPGRTFIHLHGRHGVLSDITHLFNDYGTFHSIPIIGLYADTMNTVDIRIVNASGDTLAQSTASIVTQALPPGMPTSIVVDKIDEANTEAGMYLVSNYSINGTAGKPHTPYILDDYGDIRWVLDYSTNTELSSLYYEDGIARLRNGNFYFGDSSTHTIYEVDVLGKILNRWTMPGYRFHHEVHEESNGDFILTASKDGSTYTNGDPSIEDYVIEIDRNTKQITTVWDLKESLNEYRYVWTPAPTTDWFHGNAVLDDSTDNTIIVSGRHQGIIKLDRSNNVKWILAPHENWGVNGRGDSLNKYLLTPLDGAGNPITDTSVVNGWTSASDFEWNYYQHSPAKLPNGDLLVFDNGTNRSLDPYDGSNALNGAPGKYSRAVEFKINEANKTVQQVWEYGKERDVACYSSIVSSVQYLPGSNHVIFAPGAFVQNTNGKGGKIVEIDYSTKQVVNEISVTCAGNFGHHRAKKINPYPDNL